MDEIAIEKLLVDDWASGLRLTTVPQAMRRLGIADEVDARWRMASRLYGNWQSSLETPEKVREVVFAVGLRNSSDVEAMSQGWLDQVGTWGLAPILLSENENWWPGTYGVGIFKGSLYLVPKIPRRPWMSQFKR